MGWDVFGCVVVWRKMRDGWEVELYELYVFQIFIFVKIIKIDRGGTKVYVEVFFGEIFGKFKKRGYMRMT